jgi:hypothetical protein
MALGSYYGSLRRLEEKPGVLSLEKLAKVWARDGRRHGASRDIEEWLENMEEAMPEEEVSKKSKSGGSGFSLFGRLRGWIRKHLHP